MIFANGDSFIHSPGAFAANMSTLQENLGGENRPYGFKSQVIL